MTRSRKMQPVQRAAESREQGAVRAMGDSRRQLSSQEARLDELQRYREQYTRAFETASSQGLDAGRLRDYRIFLARLNAAIEQQENILVQHRSQHEQTRQQWVASRQHSQAIDKVVDCYRQEEQRQQEQREQRESDEHALRPRADKPV